MVKRLVKGHRTTVLPESGVEYKVRFMLRKNVCEIMLDTTGAVSYTHLGMDSESIAAALLHDVVEDTPTTLDDLKAAFGEEVAQMCIRDRP